MEVSLRDITALNQRKVKKTAETPPRVAPVDVIGVVTNQRRNASIIFNRLTSRYPNLLTACQQSGSIPEARRKMVLG